MRYNEALEWDIVTILIEEKKFFKKFVKYDSNNFIMVLKRFWYRQ